MRQWIKQHWDTPTSILQMWQWIKHRNTPTSILNRCGSESNNIEIHPPHYTNVAVNQTTLRYTHLNITQMWQWFKQHWDTPTSILHKCGSESNTEIHPPQYYTVVAVNQTPKYTHLNITQMWQWIKQHWDTPTSILHKCGSESNNIEIHPPQYYTDVAVNQTTLRYTHLNITQMRQWIKQHWDTPTSILHKCGSESNNIEYTHLNITDRAVNQTTLRYTHFNITQMWQWIKHHRNTPTSGTVVMLTTSAPQSRYILDSAFDENLGPLIVTIVPPSWQVRPRSFVVSIKIWKNAKYTSSLKWKINIHFGYLFDSKCLIELFMEHA